jgi:hypothetical protein
MKLRKRLKNLNRKVVRILPISSFDNYKLDKFKHPVQCRDIKRWGRWFEKADMHVAKNYIEDFFIRTVFLAINRGWYQDIPILFETVVFRGKGGDALDEYTQRYSTYAEALMGHQLTVSRVEKILENVGSK